jgi:TPR repeat protein
MISLRRQDSFSLDLTADPGSIANFRNDPADNLSSDTLRRLLSEVETAFDIDKDALESAIDDLRRISKRNPKLLRLFVRVEEKDPDAQFELGSRGHTKNIMTEAELLISVHFYIEAAKRGHADAVSNLALICLRDDVRGIVTDDCIKSLLHIARNDSPFAAYNYALFMLGRFNKVERDADGANTNDPMDILDFTSVDENYTLDDAFNGFKFAAKSGRIPQAECNVGYFYALGIGVNEADMKKAAKYFRRSADGGSLRGAANYRLMRDERSFFYGFTRFDNFAALEMYSAPLIAKYAR